MTPVLAWLGVLQSVVKPLVLLAYSGFGLFLLWIASGHRIQPFRSSRTLAIPATFATVLTSLWFTLHSPLYLICLVIGTAVFAIRDGALGDRVLTLQGCGVVAAATSLGWWLVAFPPPVRWWQPLAFALIVWSFQAGLLTKDHSPRHRHRPTLFALFAILGVAILANMTSFQPGSDALQLLMYHQSTYINTALQIRAGLVPFFDTPLLYGLGPTLSIAAACGVSNCWSATIFLTVATTLIMGLLILRMALSTSIARGTGWTVTVTLVIFAAVFLFPGFPHLGSFPAATPSVGGLRFLPVTLVAFLLFFQHHRLASTMLVGAILWSPEVAIMALTVFGVHETSRVGFLKAATRSLSICVGSIAGLILIHHIAYGVWIQPDVMAEYILHVPMPLPVNPFSDFIFLAGAMGLAAWNIYRPPINVSSFRCDLVASSLLFATVSYYLGRSHPNNVLNLMPFIVLVALRTLDAQNTSVSPCLPRLTIIGLSSAIGVLTLSFWLYVPFQHGFSLGSAPVAEAVAMRSNDQADIRSRIANPYHLGIADLRETHRSYPSDTTVWTAMDMGSVWPVLPHNRRQLYIKRAANRLRLPGWLILGGDQRDWLDDFRVAYRVTEEKSYQVSTKTQSRPETYVVAHLVPLDEFGRK